MIKQSTGGGYADARWLFIIQSTATKYDRTLHIASRIPLLHAQRRRVAANAPQERAAKIRQIEGRLTVPRAVSLAEDLEKLAVGRARNLATVAGKTVFWYAGETKLFELADVAGADVFGFVPVLVDRVNRAVTSAASDAMHTL